MYLYIRKNFTKIIYLFCLKSIEYSTKKYLIDRNKLKKIYYFIFVIIKVFHI